MQLLSIAIFVFLAGATTRYLVHRYGGPEREEIGWWTALGLMLAASGLVHLLNRVFPHMDMPVRITANLCVYVLSMMLFLVPYKVPPVRGLLIGLAVAVILTARGFVMVMVGAV